MRYAAGFLLLLAAACSQDLQSSTSAHSSSHSAAQLQPARGLPQIGLVDPGSPAGNSVARRNVFAFPEPARAVVAPSPTAAAVSELSLKEAQERKRREDEERARIEAEERERRRRDFAFPYRYIGRFGPENAQLAAFVADGQATVVRTGEVLGGKFLVRAIGIESVEVSPLSAPELRKTLDVGQ